MFWIVMPEGTSNLALRVTNTGLPRRVARQILNHRFFLPVIVTVPDGSEQYQ